jgi:hypothetical protein
MFVGQRFGRLIVTQILTARASNGAIVCECVCDCGATAYKNASRLRSGHTRSCGCLVKDRLRQRQTKHGRYYEPEYRVWSNMNKRCKDPRFAKWYGDVRICDRWASYDAFLEDVGRKPNPVASLDRIDPKGHYEPSNVRWTTRTVQARNTKTHCTSKTGERGVSWSKTKNKWRAAIYADNKQKHLGYFNTMEEAVAARRLGEQQYWSDK